MNAEQRNAGPAPGTPAATSDGARRMLAQRQFTKRLVLLQHNNGRPLRRPPRLRMRARR